MAILNIAVIGCVASSGEELEAGAMRAETVRAFYAAESGAIVLIRLSGSGASLPAAGSELALPHGSVEFSVVPETAVPGEAVLIGRSGLAQRRVRVSLDLP